jgi:signal transduction histidine kinase
VTLGRDSLQSRLALRLLLLFAIATVVVLGIILVKAWTVADEMNQLELDRRATDLAHHVVGLPDGEAKLELPPALASIYDSPAQAYVYAIRTRGGQLIAAVPRELGELVGNWPPGGDEPSFFSLKAFGPRALDYYGYTVRIDGTAGPLTVTIAQATGTADFVHTILQEFVLDIAWIIPLVVALALAVGVLSIRHGLRPLREVSALAGTIGPNRTNIRLPERDLPAELQPLVGAFNKALERLDQGMLLQRRFTANAAHELRTPLAIITAEIDDVEDNGRLASIKEDVARMNRLVDQLLRVARLDNLSLEVSGNVDLAAVAADVVAAMAPFAIRQQRTLALREPGERVVIRGNTDAIADAIRNIVENAIGHTPPETEVTVIVDSDGSVSVADRGPGVRASDRDQIFERFWRGKGKKAPGAGLGLAIVKEIMDAHGGRVDVTDNPDGGALFTLRFQRPVKRDDEGSAAERGVPSCFPDSARNSSQPTIEKVRTIVEQL